MDPLALFDLDNTLLDREAAFSRWADSFTTEFDLPDGSLTLIGQLDEDGSVPREEFFEAVRRAFGITTPVEELVSRYYLEYPACFTVPAGHHRCPQEPPLARLEDRRGDQRPPLADAEARVHRPCRLRSMQYASRKRSERRSPIR